MQKQKAKIPVCTTSPAHRIQNSMEVPKKMFFYHRRLLAGTEPVFLASSSSSHLVPVKANGEGFAGTVLYA